MFPSLSRLATTLKKQGRRAAALTLLAALAPMAGGCYGAFPLTNIVYEFNGEISENKWVTSIAFVVMVILPIYGIATFADAIIFNLVEFWTDEPVQLSRADDGKVIVTTLDGERLGVLTPTADGGLDLIAPDGTSLGVMTADQITERLGALN